MNFFDLHCDTPYLSERDKEPIADSTLAVTFEKGKVFDRWCQIGALWVPDECLDPRERYNRMKNSFLSQITPKTTASGLDSSPAFLLSLEGGAVIEKADDVDRLYRDGVRVITLTWNGCNKLAGGCNTAQGLSDLGREVIERMNERRIALDVSHLNDRSFREALPLANRALATHTACRSVCGVRRNLTDSQLSMVAEKGGIVGLCFYPRFLGDGDVFENFATHLLHLVNTVGIGAAAIGSDFDGADMDPSLDSVDKVPALYDFLKKKGLTADNLDKIFFLNAYAYFKELLK